ncbi:MAG: sigma 54-interacting transcriptional regulator [Anaerovoracaceae bacterium]
MTENKHINEILLREMDEILDSIHDDLLIADGKGQVMRVSPTFETLYGISKELAVGKTVYQLEKEKIFEPSVIARVLDTGKKVTMRQKNNTNRDIIVTANPIFDEDKKIKMVISFSRDITEMIELEKQYSKLEDKIEKYTAEIDQLRRDATIVEGVIGHSQQMQEILETIKRVADFDANLLMLGPSGVGKTMLSKIVHQNSHRKNGRFVDINCAAIPDNLLESELFGYEKGAFTGANTNGKVGLIEMADGGTLLLDEISEMPLNLQAKLLKTIQDKVITRIGGREEIKVDFRLIAASNRDLEKFSDDGKFRKDLYYRLNVINVFIPPLKDRTEDIIPLAEYFMEKTNATYDMNKTIHPLTMKALVAYSWPGNVRELSNVMERISMICPDDIIELEDLPPEILSNPIKKKLGNMESLQQALDDLEGTLVRRAYEKYGTSVGVGEALKISQPTAHRKISKYVK